MRNNFSAGLVLSLSAGFAMAGVALDGPPPPAPDVGAATVPAHPVHARTHTHRQRWVMPAVVPQVVSKPLPMVTVLRTSEEKRASFEKGAEK